MDYFGAISAFINSAEERSFTAAAQKMGISASAVGKAVIRLEEELGVQLFHRSTRAITLTAEGKMFLQRSQRIFSDLEAAKDELTTAKSAPQGQLRISLPQLGTYLMPQVLNFQKKYPLINLELEFSDRVVNIIEEGFDAVVRIGEVNDSRLKMRQLRGYRHLLVASPEYLFQRGEPIDPEELVHHNCLRYRYPSSGRLDLWPLVRGTEPLAIDLPQSAIVNAIEPLNEMALGSNGIALLPDFTVERAIAQGRLKAILTDNLNDFRQVTLLWPSARQLLPKIRVFVDFMAESLGC